MKLRIVLLLIVVSINYICSAQFTNGTTGLIDGKFGGEFKTERLIYNGGQLEQKIISITTFNTDIKFRTYHSSFENYIQNSNKNSLKGTNIDDMLATVAEGNNFQAPMQPGQNAMFGPKPPLFDLFVSTRVESYALDPCGSGQLKLVSTCTSSGNWPMAQCTLFLLREGLAGDGFRLGFSFGAPIKQFGGGMTGEASILGQDETDPSKCVFHDDRCDASLPGYTIADRVTSTTDLTRSGRAFYTRKDISGPSETFAEFHYLNLDSAGFYELLRKPEQSRKLNFKGSYSQTSKADGQLLEQYTEQGTVSIVFGALDKKLEISAVNEEEYHKFLPIPVNEKGFKKLELKAAIDIKKNVKEDTLDFVLKEVSHYPGMATNYPSEKKAKTDADVFFAPQAEQPDNILVIDSFHVKTRDLCKEASVVIWTNDYAAYAELEAKALIQNIKGKSKYSSDLSLAIPEDIDHNKIADFWEDHVEMHETDIKQDIDKFPEGQKNSGDGLTLFEEYRGFYTKAEIPSSHSKLITTSDHVRTDPNHKDIFILDETKIYQGLVTLNDPFKLNWHFVDSTQMKIEFKAADLIWLSNKQGSVYLNGLLNKKGQRSINYNSPVLYKKGEQFGLHMIFNPSLDTSTAGAANMDLSTKYGNYQTNFIGIQNLAVFKLFITRNFKKPNGLNEFLQGESIAVFTDAEIEKVINNQFYVTFHHEVGHSLGINHHLIGEVICKNPPNAFLGPVTMNKANSREYGDECYEKLFNFGVRNCIMRYSFNEPHYDVKTRECLNEQKIFCKKGQNYVDPQGKQQDSDDCWGQIYINSN